MATQQTDLLLQKTQKPQVVDLKSMIEKSEQELGKALPSHMRSARLVRIAQTMLRLNPELTRCDPRSLIGALFQCAQLGLEPNIEGQAYILPYNSKKGPVAQFQIGYKGYIELFWRHQNSVSLQMEKVCQNDDFVYDLAKGDLSHKPAPFGEKRGAVVGYYAIAHLKNGGRALKVMSREEVMEFAKKHTKCVDASGEFKKFTPWAEHFDSMALKTVIKQLMKLLPKSIEIQHAMAMDETVKSDVSNNMVSIPNEINYAEEIEANGTEQEREPGEEN